MVGTAELIRPKPALGVLTLASVLGGGYRPPNTPPRFDFMEPPEHPGDPEKKTGIFKSCDWEIPCAI